MAPPIRFFAPRSDELVRFRINDLDSLRGVRGFFGQPLQVVNPIRTSLDEQVLVEWRLNLQSDAGTALLEGLRVSIVVNIGWLRQQRPMSATIGVHSISGPGECIEVDR
jgi:hypothetical protein